MPRKKSRSTSTSKPKARKSRRRKSSQMTASAPARKWRRKKSSKIASPSSGGATLTGNFDGHIMANGNLHFAKGSSCKVNAKAPSVSVDGKVKGVVVAKKTMKLGPSCHVHGTIVADRLVCADGASFNGLCKLGRYKKAA